MRLHKGNPASRANASRAPKMLILADSASENIPSPASLQLKFLRRRFGLAPTLAPIVAFHLFGEAQQ